METKEFSAEQFNEMTRSLRIDLLKSCMKILQTAVVL